MSTIVRPDDAKSAFGHPGLAPRWTTSSKEAVGTAYFTASRVWYTLSHGILNEVYYPTIDRPQIRDLEYLITDGETFFHEEKRDLHSSIECLSPYVLGYRIESTDPEARYRIIKEVIADPHQPCVLIHTRLEGDEDLLARLKLYVLLAPHLEVGGWRNTGQASRLADRVVLTACKGEAWLALGATVPFVQSSCGYVGASDGWTDLRDNFQMDWTFDVAEDGNIALTGELDLSQGRTFTLGLAFGDGFHSAVTSLFQVLETPFAHSAERFVEQWSRAMSDMPPLEEVSGDGGYLYRVSHNLLLAHEDKKYQGAFIASLSIPWGEVRGEEDLGGYHLVWTRDMYHTVMGLLAAGNTDTPARALIYLACAQQQSGGFPQNFWIDGEAYWRGVQLDGVAFPVMLAWQLHSRGLLRSFDPYPLVRDAARFLIEQGPATPQERWEENSGYSPSTLASNIAALTCAAAFARERGDETTATFVQAYADFLEARVEAWTVTTEGSLVPDVSRHYIRITPVEPGAPHPNEDPNTGMLPIRNRPPGPRAAFPAKEVVDAGFLELVRYGIRRAGDPLIEDSLRVVDAVLKVETPFGPCWRRYNHDGYGQREDGGPYQGWGRGRAWPLLTGERGHYELAAGRDVGSHIRAMEGFAYAAGLLPEQVWDAQDLPEAGLYCGCPAGSAMPLMWAHAEYVRLLRSVKDGEVFDRIPVVAARYLGSTQREAPEVWKFGRQVRSVRRGATLRVQATAAFVLRWTLNEWQDLNDTPSTATALGIGFVDIRIPEEQRAPVRFTFRWAEVGRWEGRDYEVGIAQRFG